MKISREARYRGIIEKIIFFLPNLSARLPVGRDRRTMIRVEAVFIPAITY